MSLCSKGPKSPSEVPGDDSTGTIKITNSDKLDNKPEVDTELAEIIEVWPSATPRYPFGDCSHCADLRSGHSVKLNMLRSISMILIEQANGVVQPEAEDKYVFR